MKLSKDKLDSIFDKKITTKDWIFELGVGYVYENDNSGYRYLYPYEKIGFQLWQILKSDIYDIICNKGAPKEWVSDLITGDFRNLAIGIVTAITAKYDVSIGIALPITALIIKAGIIKFCKKKEVPKDIKKIIGEKILLTMNPYARVKIDKKFRKNSKRKVQKAKSVNL
jgi:hypothetical protein